MIALTALAFPMAKQLRPPAYACLPQEWGPDRQANGRAIKILLSIPSRSCYGAPMICALVPEARILWRRGLPLALAIGTLATGERAEPGIAPLLKERDAAAASLASPRLRESPCGALASSPPCLAAGNRAEPGVGPQMAGERTLTLQATAHG